VSVSERAVVLVSGGLDSATTLAIARTEGFACHALTVDYGQRHRAELERARTVCRKLGVVDHRIVGVDLGFVGASALTDPSIAVPKAPPEAGISSGIPVTYVPARNTVLLSLALAWAEAVAARDLFLGVNAVDYSGYPDCRPEFLEAFERLANLATRSGVEDTEHPFRVHAPLLHSAKADIVRRALELEVDPAWTVSCYDPTPAGRPCGRCDACRLRARGFREAGIEDPAVD
jgi:7-cyano-7-deazaguanine synthase